MRKYPLKGIADEIESHGRFGDTELVHLNPVEVAGLAALSPTGKLSINPVTGKKEAFLPLLLPIIASYGGSALAASAGASMVGAAIAGGAASGLATYATTGDAERGLYSGIMGAGLGAAAGAAGEAARGVADPALTEGIMAGVTPGMEAGTVMGEEAARLAAEQAATEGVASSVTVPFQNQPLPNPMEMAPATEAGAGNMFTTGAGPTEGGFTGALQDPFMAPKGEGMISQVTKPASMLPIAMGGNQLLEMDAMDAMEGESKDAEARRKKRLQQAYGDLQGAYGRAQPNLASGASPFRSGMSQNTPAPWSPDGYAQGGIVSLAGGGRFDRGVTYAIDPSMHQRNFASRASQSQTGGGNPMAGRDSGYGSANMGYGGIDPVSIQAGMRGQHHVATAPGYMAGMQPEFNYFQDDLENIQVPQGFSPEQLMAPYNTQINRFAAETPPGANTPYFKSNVPQKKQGDVGMAAGGQVPVSMGGEQAMINGGGIANVPNEYTQPQAAPQAPNMPMPQAAPQAGGQPSEQDITLLASALMGENPEHADKIVEAFVQQYGPEKFAEIRQQILQMIQGPNAQTEGMIRGQGGGMDDQVMGTIGAEQPVAVSPGEYIVPADVVSGLGDGSSDAGAAELDRMQQDVRMARGGGTTQPPAIDARRVMPA